MLNLRLRRTSPGQRAALKSLAAARCDGFLVSMPEAGIDVPTSPARAFFDGLREDASLFFETQALRYCPLCMGESGLHTVWQQCTLFDACPLDGCMLRTTCVHCEGRLTQVYRGPTFYALGYRCCRCQREFAGTEPRRRVRFDEDCLRPLLDDVYGPWDRWLTELVQRRVNCKFVGDRRLRAQSIFSTVHEERSNRERLYWLRQFPPPNAFGRRASARCEFNVLEVALSTEPEEQFAAHENVLTELREMLASQCTAVDIRRAERLAHDGSLFIRREIPAYATALVLTELLVLRSQNRSTSSRRNGHTEEHVWQHEFMMRRLNGVSAYPTERAWRAVVFALFDAILDWLLSVSQTTALPIDMRTLESVALSSAYVINQPLGRIASFIVSPRLEEMWLNYAHRKRGATDEIRLVAGAAAAH